MCTKSPPFMGGFFVSQKAYSRFILDKSVYNFFTRQVGVRLYDRIEMKARKNTEDLSVR